MRSTKTKSLFRLGCHNTLLGLVRKLPLFGITVLAMLILTSLDGVRTNYEIMTGSAGRPFEIGDDLLQALKPQSMTKLEAAVNTAALRQSESTSKLKTQVAAEESVKPIDEILWDWLNEPYRFRYQKFAHRRALLDALAAKAMVVTEERRAALRKTRDEEFESQIKLEAQLEVADRNGTPKSEIEKEIEAHQKEITALEAQILQLDTRLRDTTTYVYRTFANDLPHVLMRVQRRQQGLLDDLLKPILDEQSSLNVLYQVFRLTALIAVILSFVFILLMLFQQSPFSNETDTVSAQLKTLISLKSAGVAGEIAKTAIISVTVLGVGTAVFIGATSPDTAAPWSRFVNTSSTVSEKIRERFGDILFPVPSGQPISDPVAEEYFLQTLISERNRNFYFYDLRRLSNGPQPAGNFNSTILPAPVEVRTVVVPGGNSQALLDELKILITKVNSVADLTLMRLQITALQGDVTRLNKPECQCKEALSAIASRLETLNTTHPTTTSSPSPSPSTASPAKITNPMPISTPVPTPESIAASLTKTADALNAIDKDLKAMRADILIKLDPSTGNIATRTKQFLGSEYYFVSEQTYLALQDLLKGNSNYAALMTALQEMKKQPPLGKDRFLSALRKGITEPNQKELKPWERVILSYARLHR